MTEPGVFALPPGADFPAALVAGLLQRMAGRPPEELAGVTLLLNTARMRRRVEAAFQTSGARLLPRLRLITDLSAEVALAGLPAAVPALRRRLELAQLVGRLLDRQPDIAPRGALFDLADSLAALMAEMQVEGVTPDRIAGLDVSNHSAHFARTQAFLGIVAPFFTSGQDPDAEARQRQVVDRLILRWQDTPPAGPTIVAGSTGSRGTTARLMAAVARLPQGMLVLPGFDFDMPRAAWDSLDDALTAEDHPQFRFRRLLDALDLTPDQVRPWHDAPAPAEPRNRVVSLALRPAPVTDQWLREGPGLADLVEAMAEVSLIEAPSPRTEALAIALVLREAAETGTRAALVTPDRTLARQVTAALDRWSILPDDSAGRPLGLSAPGRFLRHVARLFGQRLSNEPLLTLLKHPLCASGPGRGAHLLRVRAMELHLRRRGPAFPDGATILDWARSQADAATLTWAEALARALSGCESAATRTLAEHVSRHRNLAEALARGEAADGSAALWEAAAGRAALEALEALSREAAHGGDMTPEAYADLFDTVLADKEVRETVAAHPLVMIWGTLEARVQGADLVILGGLNDGTWPAMPPPDPWLNRPMRKAAGLLLPDRQIGLSAHDFQQAVGAPRVVLTRALRDAEAETVPSRWLNRMLNLMGGLAGRRGPEALAGMRERGSAWLHLAEALDRPAEALPPAPRPSPRPPVAQRPTELSLTRIAVLIRDPYAIYARYVLRLWPLDPLRRSPDARLRGVVLHRVLERFVKERPASETDGAARARLLATASDVLAEETPWPTARALWLARIDRAANFFLRADARYGGVAVSLEKQGRLRVEPLDFTLFGTPDRIDRLPDGRLHLIDYKTGSPPSEKQQATFDKQLLLAAAMAERGGFADLGPTEVGRISYVGLGNTPKEVETELSHETLDAVWEGLVRLMQHYDRVETGYTARRAMFSERQEGDYDHLSRLGEWEMTDLPQGVAIP